MKKSEQIVVQLKRIAYLQAKLDKARDECYDANAELDLLAKRAEDAEAALTETQADLAAVRDERDAARETARLYEKRDRLEADLAKTKTAIADAQISGLVYTYTPDIFTRAYLPGWLSTDALDQINRAAPKSSPRK